MTETPHEYLTVRELAALLRVGERKIYDLVSTGALPVTRVTGKLLFPRAQVEAMLEGRSGTGPAEARPAVFLGSHDPLLEWALRESRAGIATRFDSSLDGLERFLGGEGIAAGLHVPEPGGWNRETISARAAGRNAVLVRWATRSRGIVTADPKISGVADLTGRRLARRQSEAGAELLLRRLLEDASIGDDALAPPLVVRSEADAVLAVKDGQADAAVGLKAMAGQYGLSFVPLAEEAFDILVDRAAWFSPPMQALWAFAGTAAFRDKAERLGGYNVAGCGGVVWNA